MKEKKNYKKIHYWKGWGFAALVLVLFLNISIVGAFEVGIEHNKKLDVFAISPLTNYEPPVIITEGCPTEGYINEENDFTFSVKYGEPPFNWSVYWGDGTEDSETNVKERIVRFIKVYTSAGEYQIKIRVTDSINNTDDAIIKFDVYCPPPIHLGVIIDTKYFWESEYMETSVDIDVIVENHGKRKVCDYNISLSINGTDERNTADCPGRCVYPNGGEEKYCYEFELENGYYSVHVEVTQGSGKDKERIDSNDCWFFVLNEKLCNFLRGLKEKLPRIFDKYILPVLIEYLK